MTAADSKDIQSWLESDRDYEEGVRLFNLHSRNTVLKRIFPNKEARYANKLAYELGKIISRRPVEELKKLPNQKPSPLKPSPEPENKENFESMFLVSGDSGQPKVIRRIISEFSELYKQRSIAHNQLKRLPPDNRPENVEGRRGLVGQIARYSDRMDELYAAHKSWTETQVLPEENILFPVTGIPEPVPQEEVGKELTRIRLNLMKSLNSDLNQLSFQSIRKQPVGNPMPAGPKRDLLEKRIKAKQKKIDDLKLQIHGLGHVQ